MKLLIKVLYENSLWKEKILVLIELVIISYIWLYSLVHIYASNILSHTLFSNVFDSLSWCINIYILIIYSIKNINLFSECSFAIRELQRFQEQIYSKTL